MENNVKRTLGIFSASSMLVGIVLGASIFIVPGALAAEIGPAAWLSYLIGGLMILFTCFTYAQVGSSLPVSGANYILCVKGVNGFWGLLYVWLLVIVSVFLLPIMAFGMINYLGAFIPALGQTWVAFAALILTGAINVIGFSLSAKLQNVMVAIKVSVVAIFVLVGFFFIEPGNYVPMFPVGFAPVLVGAISTYYAFAGFNAIVDISGEIKNPKKNFPRIIFFSFTIIAILYIGMCLVMTGVVPWNQLGVPAPAVLVGEAMLPAWFGYFITLAMLASAWTCINGTIGSVARDLYAISQTGVLPKFFGNLNRWGTPYVGVIALTVLAIVATAFSADIMKYVNITSVYLLLASTVVGVAALRMRKRIPAQYEASGFKLKGFWYYFWPVGIVVTSVGLLILAMSDDFLTGMISLGMIALIYVLYLARRIYLKGKGISLDDLAQNSADQAIAGIGQDK